MYICTQSHHRRDAFARYGYSLYPYIHSSQLHLQREKPGVQYNIPHMRSVSVLRSRRSRGTFFSFPSLPLLVRTKCPSPPPTRADEVTPNQHAAQAKRGLLGKPAAEGGSSMMHRSSRPAWKGTAKWFSVPDIPLGHKSLSSSAPRGYLQLHGT